MAKIIEEKYVITLSQLVKSNVEEPDFVNLDEDTLTAIQETIESLIDNASVIVEVQPDGEVA
jgi:hypothetical protein